jgi:glycosyltransferase involved in cell wall biosynthesis
MKVLLVGNFQGPEMIQRRNIRRNRSLAGSKKMHSICYALAKRGHDISILSVGRAAERSWKWYPRMEEAIHSADGSSIPATYVGTFDYPGIGNIVSWLGLLFRLPKLCRRGRFDVALLYNCDFDSVVAAACCRLLGSMRVVVEYEDSALLSRSGKISLRHLRRLKEKIIAWCSTAVFGPSPELVEAMDVPRRLLLEGALTAQLAGNAASRVEVAQPGTVLRVLYSGHLAESKGVLMMMDALESVDSPLEIHVSGAGCDANVVKARCERSRHRAVFHGLVSDEQLVQLQVSADVCINPLRALSHQGVVWPFKVAEYMAACGIVISSRTGKIDDAVEQRLFVYDQDDPGALAATLRGVIANWEQVRHIAAERRKWAIDRWGPIGVGEKLERLFLDTCPTQA